MMVAPKKNEVLVRKLEEYFSTRKDVAFAFLYGSQAKANATKLSDIDVAVYFYPKARHPIEYEEEVFYDSEDEIWGELEKILTREVELLVLNRAPAHIAATAIRGIPVVIHDRGCYIDFLEVITHVAEDFREFIIRDYKERIEYGKGR